MTEAYKLLYQYDLLEAAFIAANINEDDLPYDIETWLINLQNHLIWRSYKPHDDPIADTVILQAIRIIKE